MLFQPEKSKMSSKKETRLTNRAPLHRRLNNILLGRGAIFHLLYVLAYFAATAVFVTRAYSRFPNDIMAFRLYLLTHIGWAPLPWLVTGAACLRLHFDTQCFLRMSRRGRSFFQETLNPTSPTQLRLQSGSLGPLILLGMRTFPSLYYYIVWVCIIALGGGDEVKFCSEFAPLG